jgi:NAD(P)H dehydrogenase (quinone)
MNEILIVYYSSGGATHELARMVARGVDSVTNASAKLRTVPRVSAVSEAVESDIPSDGPPYASPDDLKNCAGLILGSPVRFGNMAAPLKYFIDQHMAVWWLKRKTSRCIYIRWKSARGARKYTVEHDASPLSSRHDPKRYSLL